MTNSQPEADLVIDIDYLTGKEIIAIEELSDIPFDELGTPGKKKGRLLVAIATVLKQREDPSYTFEQASELRIRLSDDPVNPSVPGSGNG